MCGAARTYDSAVSRVVLGYESELGSSYGKQLRIPNVCWKRLCNLEVLSSVQHNLGGNDNGLPLIDIRWLRLLDLEMGSKNNSNFLTQAAESIYSGTEKRVSE